MDGRRIFINAGALFDAKTPNEIIGVLAHETGHIAGGHLVAPARAARAARRPPRSSRMLLGVGARGRGRAQRRRRRQSGRPPSSAPQETIRRSLLSYQRAQEEQADRAGVKFLNATGQSAKGMYDTFKRLADEILFAAQNADPYHAVASDAGANASRRWRSSPRPVPIWDKKDPPELQLRHDLMRAKLSGFLERPDTVARRYPSSDTSLPARYARAIATYRHADLRTAIAPDRRR